MAETRRELNRLFQMASTLAVGSGSLSSGKSNHVFYKNPHGGRTGESLFCFAEDYKRTGTFPLIRS